MNHYGRLGLTLEDYEHMYFHSRNIVVKLRQGVSFFERRLPAMFGYSLQENSLWRTETKGNKTGETEKGNTEKEQ